MYIKYNSIRDEYRSLGISRNHMAKILGITPAALDYRIRKDKPTIHWAMYGIANYYATKFDDEIIDETT